MSVYVDARSRADDRTGIASHTLSGSHLMADMLEELLTFGSRIGLRAGWLTVEPGGVHFELNSGERVFSGLRIQHDVCMAHPEPQMHPPRHLSAVGLFAVALVPWLVALLPGVMVPLWNFQDPEHQTYLTPFRVVWLSGLMLAVCLPFVAAVLTLVVVRFRSGSWARAFLVGAAVAGVLGCVAFVAVGITTMGL